MKRFVFSAVTALAIVVASLIPVPEIPQADIPFADKWAHWVMYGTLTLVISYDLMRSKSLSIRNIVVGAVFAVVLGGLLELMQAYCTSTRSGDWLDFYANTFGVFCAVVIVLIYKKMHARNRGY